MVCRDVTVIHRKRAWVRGADNNYEPKYAFDMVTYLRRRENMEPTRLTVLEHRDKPLYNRMKADDPTAVELRPSFERILESLLDSPQYVTRKPNTATLRP